MKESTHPAPTAYARVSVLARLRLVAPLILLAACAVAWLWSRWSGPGAGTIDLEAQANEQAKQSEEQFQAYAPASSVRLDDLAADADALLRGVPGVARVVRQGPASKPAMRIVQLCDSPLVPAESLRLQPDSGAYREYLARAEMLHHQQVAFLRCLVRRHGVKAIHTPGLTDVSSSVWRENVALLKGMLVNEPDLLAARTAGKQASEAGALLARVRSQRLQTGPVGVLEALGEVRALPLEQRPGGGPDREAAIVSRLLAAGPLSVIVLAGRHDLAEEFQRQGLLVQYLRVEMTRYAP
jgi:hypothetical protein